jgi:hypothetical protein
MRKTIHVADDPRELVQRCLRCRRVLLDNRDAADFGCTPHFFRLGDSVLVLPDGVALFTHDSADCDFAIRA